MRHLTAICALFSVFLFSLPALAAPHPVVEYDAELGVFKDSLPYLTPFEVKVSLPASKNIGSVRFQWRAESPTKGCPANFSIARNGVLNDDMITWRVLVGHRLSDASKDGKLELELLPQSDRQQRASILPLCFQKKYTFKVTFYKDNTAAKAQLGAKLKKQCQQVKNLNFLKTLKTLRTQKGNTKQLAKYEARFRTTVEKSINVRLPEPKGPDDWAQDFAALAQSYCAYVNDHLIDDKGQQLADVIEKTKIHTNLISDLNGQLTSVGAQYPRYSISELNTALQRSTLDHHTLFGIITGRLLAQRIVREDKTAHIVWVRTEAGAENDLKQFYHVAYGLNQPKRCNTPSCQQKVTRINQALAAIQSLADSRAKADKALSAFVAKYKTHNTSTDHISRTPIVATHLDIDYVSESDKVLNLFTLDVGVGCFYFKGAGGRILPTVDVNILFSPDDPRVPFYGEGLRQLRLKRMFSAVVGLTFARLNADKKLRGLFSDNLTPYAGVGLRPLSMLRFSGGVALAQYNHAIDAELSNWKLSPGGYFNVAVDISIYNLITKAIKAFN